MYTNEQFIQIMKALSDTSRCKIVYLLSAGDLCQIHIQQLTNMGQVNISRHAQKLVNANIITTQKISNRQLYSLNQEFINNFSELLMTITKIYNNHFDQKIVTENIIACKNMN